MFTERVPMINEHIIQMPTVISGGNHRKILTGSMIMVERQRFTHLKRNANAESHTKGSVKTKDTKGMTRQRSPPEKIKGRRK